MIGYMADLGVERTLWKPGASRLELTLTEDHLNKGGVAHGGIHMMLLDSALGSALVASLKVEEWCATAQLSTSFLAAARPGERMVAEGRVLRRGKNVAHLAGEVKVGERLVASATGTWAIWSSRPPSLLASERGPDNGDKGIGE